MQKNTIPSLKYSITVLIIANSIPLMGVLFFNWNIFMILILYWIESAIIGFYNILKMIKTNKSINENSKANAYLNFNPTTNLTHYFKIFFIIHFGGFMFGHLIFIFAISSLFQDKLALNISDIIFSVSIGIISLFISHGFSYYNNFLKNREYDKISINQLFTQPYSRIVVMHFTIIFGAFLIGFFKAPSAIIMFLVILKTTIDVRSHIKEHTVFNVG
ncbi:MAG: DUF6498-containing protein [Nanoarchaeota archaeon]